MITIRKELDLRIVDADSQFTWKPTPEHWDWKLDTRLEQLISTNALRFGHKTFGDDHDLFFILLRKCGDVATQNLKEALAAACQKLFNGPPDMLESPDVLVMDILYNKPRKSKPVNPLGLKLLNAVRKQDSLVPALAVTVAPAEVIMQGVALEECGFCGIYPSSILSNSSGLFKTALRQSLNMWHVQVPEFALARRCLHALQSVSQDVGDIVGKRLSSAVMELPHIGSINAWHHHLGEQITDLLHECKYERMELKFKTMVSIFADSDPFYMAGTSSRRHLSHNVQVFLLGLAIMLADTEIRQSAIANFKKLKKDCPEAEALADAVLTWACISLTHDCAYLSQAMKKVCDKLNEIACVYAPVLGLNLSAAPIFDKTLTEWPETPHPKVASDLWLVGLKNDGSKEETMIRLIASAVERHDSNYAKHTGLGTVSNQEWTKFLAVLCDELQDWQRLRDTTSPGIKMDGEREEKNPWRNFAVERIDIGTEPVSKKNKLAIDFVIQDHPRIVKEDVGMAGRKSVESRFDEILDVIKDNLTTQNGWLISLRAEFVSRSVNAVVKSRELQQIPKK